MTAMRLVMIHIMTSVSTPIFDREPSSLYRWLIGRSLLGIGFVWAEGEFSRQ
jgi:hypothetical protein